MDVGNQEAQTQAGIGQEFVQMILLGSEHAAEFLAPPGKMAQVTDIGWQNERRRYQSGTRQGRQPLRIADIRLAARNVLGIPGLDHPGAPPTDSSAA